MYVVALPDQQLVFKATDPESARGVERFLRDMGLPKEPRRVAVVIGAEVTSPEAVDCLLKIAAWIDAEERTARELEARAEAWRTLHPGPRSTAVL